MSTGRVQTWLNLMHVEYQFDVDSQSFETEWIVDSEILKVFISCRPDGWIKIQALLLEADDVTSEFKENLYPELLYRNFELDDVTYSMDGSGNIYAENDLNSHSNVETFLSEINAVVYGAQFFNQRVLPNICLLNSQSFNDTQ